MRKSLPERLKQDVFFLDGAMGTQLMAAGVEPGACNEYINLLSPEMVIEIHRRYLEAGCDGIITNTFGANAVALKRHGHEKEAYEINKAGALAGRQAAGPDRYVLGDVGPTGDFLKPLGTLEPLQLKDAFAEQVRGLVDGGVDGIIIETMTAVDELCIAIQTARLTTDLPMLASLAFDPAKEGFRTMMGIDPAGVVAQTRELGLTAIGFNCGTLTMDQYIRLAETYSAALEDTNMLLLAEPNAGKPELIDAKAVYKLSPEEYAAAAKQIFDAGAGLLGGCCGTTPEHIKAMVKAIRG
ncbi:MAG: homocysteine S-methyltransferase family protein [Sedimentisphaerales bacterium]|nr:homocysteine S-methyltransferase family protein [Sedimentisphaerales bacterium]